MNKITLLAALLVACGSKDPIAQLQDPATCMECHPKHYQQWSGSMHAYASDDPVFLAMNKRGQRETSGALGTFCIQCHAPMAVKLGLATTENAKDFDPAGLPSTARGITCYFCHNVASVGDTHNNGLVLAMDDVMRGGARDPEPVDSPAHNSAYDPAMASRTNKSTMCGSCHDVVTPRGVALERTFTEWRRTIFAHDDPARMFPLTCSNCHMLPSKDVIADKPGLNVPSRDNGFHDHGFPAIDQALTDFPEKDAQNIAIDGILKNAVAIKGPTPPPQTAQPGGICVEPNQIKVRMDTFGTGHMFPSGAAQDRRVWLELKVYDVNGVVLLSSGVAPDGVDPDDLGVPRNGFFWDRTFNDASNPAHFFWDVATPPTSFVLNPPITTDPNEDGYDHSTTAVFPIPVSVKPQIDHITARLRTLPVAYAVLDDLIASGDLDPAIRAQMKVLDVPLPDGLAVWTKATQNPITFCNPFPSPPLP